MPIVFWNVSEDFAVKRQRLISQWIAEGFIQQQKGKTLEEVAEEYLKELMERSLVQVPLFTIDGKAKSCRVHDMVREMILRKAEDLNFCQYIHEDDSLALCGESRRLSIATSTTTFLGGTKNSHIRSLIIFTDKESPEILVKRIPAQCKLLKVLDFESYSFSCNFPESFLNLLHLKYLSFRDTDLGSLPKSIVKLENLETLDVRETNVSSLPQDINKLRKLRHLWGDFKCFAGNNCCLGDMNSLQTLSKLEIQSFEVELINKLGELSQLRNLKLSCKLEEGESQLLWNSINKMKNLEKLCLGATLFHDLDLISPLPKLRKLSVGGTLEKLPGWISKLPNLVKLTLVDSNLTDDPLESLKKLPNLLSLNMAKCYTGESLHFEDTDFQKLKQLTLRYMTSLNSIVIDERALNSLKVLTLQELPQLKAVPSGVHHLKKLEVLNFYLMPHELVGSITPDRGHDYWIIKHVPNVNI